MNTTTNKQPTDQQIASDIHNGKIFCDRHIRPHDVASVLGMVFMPLVMGAKIDPDDTGMLYEYMSEAGPRSVNGYPIFMSMRVATKDQANRILVMLRRLAKRDEAKHPLTKAYHQLMFALER